MEDKVYEIEDDPRLARGLRDYQGLEAVPGAPDQRTVTHGIGTVFQERVKASASRTSGRAARAETPRCCAPDCLRNWLRSVVASVLDADRKANVLAANLTKLKAEIMATWPMTAYETLDRVILQPRLLLCLQGLGTNTGLQRMAGLRTGATYKDLAYVRRRYISVDATRRAIAIVATAFRAGAQAGRDG